MHVQRANLETDGVRRLAIMGAASHPQPDFVRLRPALDLIMQARHADQIYTKIVIRKTLQFQPFLDDLGGPFGARDGIDAALGNLALADIAVGIADIDLVGGRGGAGLRGREPVAVRRLLAQRDPADVEDAIRCESGDWVVDVIN